MTSMYDNFAFDKLTLSLINSIENRREIISFFRINYLSKSEEKEDGIFIKKIILEELLDEFQFTISQSLQAIKTLQVETSNIKEMILNVNEVKIYFNNLNTNSLNNNLANGVIGNEQANYNFISPNHTEYENNNFEEMSFSPNTRRETENYDEDLATAKFNRDKDREINEEVITNKNNELSGAYQYQFDGNFDTPRNNDTTVPFNKNTINNDNNLIYHRTTNLNSFMNSNESLANTKTNPFSKNYLSYSKGLNLNYDYSSLKCNNSLVESINQENQDTDRNNIYVDELNDNHISSYNNSNNNNNNKTSYNQTNIYNTIENDNTINNKTDKEEDHNNQNIHNSSYNYKPFPIPDDNLDEDEPTERSIAQEYFNNNNNQTISSNTYNFNVKQGLRQKLKNSKMNTQNSNSPRSKNQTIEIERQFCLSNNNQLYANKYHTVDKDSNYETSEGCAIDTEYNAPIILSKREAFNNRLYDIEREIIASNLLKRINRTEGIKPYLAKMYGDGSYEQFVEKLNNYQLDLENIDAELNNYNKDLINYNSHSTKNIKISKNNIDLNKEKRKDKYYYGNVEMGLPSRPRSSSGNNFYKNPSNTKKGKLLKDTPENQNKNDSYIEPVRFENFLRSGSKPKKKNNIKFSNTRKRQRNNSTCHGQDMIKTFN